MLTINQLQNSEYLHFINALEQEAWFVEKAHMESLYKEYSQDFFIAYLDKVIVGFIVALKYTKDFGLISNFIVLPKFRNKGYAKVLFTHAMKHLGVRQIALECKKRQEKLYEKYGFKTYYEVKYYKYTIDTKMISTISSKTTLSYLSDNKKLFSYNTEMPSVKFADYLYRVIQDKQTLFQAIYKKNKLLAYGLCTKYKDGYKLVLSAQTSEEMYTLFYKLIDGFKLSTSIYIEVEDTQKELLELVTLLHMKEDSVMQKMYNKIL